jgi:hypothetical protein
VVDLEADAAERGRGVDAAGDGVDVHLLALLHRVRGAAVGLAEGSLRLCEEVVAVRHELVERRVGAEDDHQAPALAAEREPDPEALDLDGARRAPAGRGAPEQQPLAARAADHQARLRLVDDRDPARGAEDLGVDRALRRLHARQRSDRVGDPRLHRGFRAGRQRGEAEQGGGKGESEGARVRAHAWFRWGANEVRIGNSCRSP